MKLNIKRKYRFHKLKIWFVKFVIILFFISVAVPVNETFANTVDENTLAVLEEIAEGVLDWKKNTEKVAASDDLIETHLSKAAGTPAADWYAIASGMLYPEKEFPVYLNSLYDFVNNEYEKGISLNSSPIDFHRIIIAINSLGGDASLVPTEISGQNINLISDFVYNRKNLNMLINTLTWGLMALDSLNYETPAESAFDREKIIGEIINLKIPGKGFALTGSNSDPDITAMVIQALAPYYFDEKKYALEDEEGHGKSEITVREVIDESLELLSSMQLSSGDFKSWGNRNSQTGAQVIIALCKLRINPFEDNRFIKDGVSLFDGLVGYRQENKGFANLSDSNRSDSKAGEQALLAMTAMIIQKRDDSKIFIFKQNSDKPLTPDDKSESESEIQTKSGTQSDTQGSNARESQISGTRDDLNNGRSKIFIVLAIVFVAAVISGIIIVKSRRRL